MPGLPRGVKPLPGSPQYQWDERARRYRNAGTGRFVPWPTVRRELDNGVKKSAGEMRTLAQGLQAGRMSLADWQLAMMQQIKTTNMAAVVMQRGGWPQMNQADFGRVGQVIRREYQFLQGFAEAVASGKQKLDGTFLRRAELYGKQGRGTYYAFQDQAMAVNGFDEERSVLNPADHCDECVSEAARDWQPMGSIVPIGQRQCRSNCHCHKQYRNSVTGEVVTI